MKSTTNTKQIDVNPNQSSKKSAVNELFQIPGVKDMPLDVQKFFGFVDKPEQKAPMSKAQAANELEKRKRLTIMKEPCANNKMRR